MARLSRAVASLRIAGDDLIPDDVSVAVGATPSLAYARGDVVTTSQGVARTTRSGLWSYAGPETEPGDIDSQVSELLSGLSSDLSVWDGLAERFKLDIFCGWFLRSINEGVEVSAEALTALGERHIILSLDIYGGDQVSADH